MPVLGWVCCAQRVTTMDAADLTIAGWSRGVLVEFLIRGGRLRAWHAAPVPSLFRQSV
jgi:hypothetical protein